MKSEGTIQSSIYGDKLPELQKVCDELSAYISEVRAEIEAKTGMDVRDCRRMNIPHLRL